MAEVPTAPFVGKVTGCWFSPPCPMFSAAGTGQGLAVMHLLEDGLRDLLSGADTRSALFGKARPIIRELVAEENETRRKPRSPEHVDREADRRTTEALLVLEPARFVHDLRPQWVACEQVPAVLPLWRALGRGLEALGYGWWAGILDAADFGVPQNRRRAILMAHADRVVQPPPPTHADYRRSPSLFLDPWVSMAEALGWGMTERPGITVAVGTGGGPDPQGAGGSGARRTVARARARAGEVG